MPVQLEQSWLDILREELGSAYFLRLNSFLDTELNEGRIIFPPQDQIFSAFNATPFNKVKVVIIGQDPYHGLNQAHGLCFSVNDGISHPPSLKNIFKELGNDLIIPYPKSGNLLAWARQGVLLLNATLTVREGEAGSHQGIGWEKFTSQIIKLLNLKKEGLVFMLWGSKAKAYGRQIDFSKHFVLESGHPSPLSANRGFWFGNKHFSQCNAYLRAKGEKEIDWKID